MVADPRASGVGNNYLVQHSAGSGKSNSIAWLAHRLASLYDDTDEKVFDSVIVVTDRWYLISSSRTPYISSSINKESSRRLT